MRLNVPTTRLVVGQPVSVEVIVVNTHPYPVTRGFSSACQVGYEIRDAHGRLLTHPPGCAAIVTHLTLEAGEERVFVLDWTGQELNQEILAPQGSGRCRMKAGLYGSLMELTDLSAAIEIEIVVD